MFVTLMAWAHASHTVRSCHAAAYLLPQWHAPRQAAQHAVCAAATAAAPSSAAAPAAAPAARSPELSRAAPCPRRRPSSLARRPSWGRPSEAARSASGPSSCCDGGLGGAALPARQVWTPTSGPRGLHPEGNRLDRGGGASCGGRLHSAIPDSDSWALIC